MPDGSGKGGFAGNIEEYGEAVLKPVKDEAGKILETAANSFGASNNPQDQAKKQQEQAQRDAQNAKKKQTVMQWLSFFKQQEAVQRQKKQQEDFERKQKESQEDQEKKRVKQIQVEQKGKGLHPEFAARGKSEIKRGGVGG